MLPINRQSPTLGLLLATAILLGNSIQVYAEESASTEPTNMPQEMATPKPTSGTVARAIFTSQMVDREPTNILTELANDTQRVYFFTDLRDMTGQIITHQWEYAGNVMAEVKFKVGDGHRWRVYSSKNLLPEWTGEWKVSVIDENGSTLKVSTLNYIPAASSDKANSDTATSPDTTMPVEQQKNSDEQSGQ